jgi:hypothetical protein
MLSAVASDVIGNLHLDTLCVQESAKARAVEIECRTKHLDCSALPRLRGPSVVCTDLLPSSCPTVYRPCSRVILMV